MRWISSLASSRARRSLIGGLGGFVVAAGVGLAGWQVALVWAAARGDTPLHFDQGLTALDPGAPASWTNEWCGSCHRREFDSWKVSRHAVAGINKNFQAQFHKDPQQWCLNCHAPINPGRDQMPIRRLPTDEPTEQLFGRAPAWLTRGVDCLTCHVRDGNVIVARPGTVDAEQAHPVRLLPELGNAEFCAGCHQFRFKSSVFEDSFLGENQQASLEEFLERSQDGGLETRCHTCHMPQGDHRMPGGYDLAMLRRAVGLELHLEWLDELLDDLPVLRVHVKVSARRVGHRVPGGEYFRFLTLHTTVLDASGSPVNPLSVLGAARHSDPEQHVVTEWPQIETLRRHIGSFERTQSGTPLTDTRLWPDETRGYTYLVPMPAAAQHLPLTARTEIWYHVLDEAETRFHGLEPAETQWLVREARTELELAKTAERFGSAPTRAD